jgi:heat shock protein HslJ
VIRDRLAVLLMTTALSAVPVAAVAQDEAGPEGTGWTLTGYLDEDSAEMLTVPFGVNATLRLQDGVASGSGGCNQFTGSYQIDGSSLRFDEEMTKTLALCEDEIQTVEDAYLAALGETDGWTIDLDVLEFSDDFGDVILTFEVPQALWTTSQMTGLMATLTSLQAELDVLLADEHGIDVAGLQDRVKVLESDNRKLKKRLNALEDTPKPTATPKPVASFSKAENVLLEGIPTRIANYCEPLRSQLPKGTQAAVTCRPKTSIVAGVDYYLMEGDRAATAFGNQMTAFNVSDAISESATCQFDVKSQRHWIGRGWQAEGCYRSNGLAAVRFVDNATDCRKLKVDGTRLESPALLIALHGNDKDMARVHAWATRNVDAYPGQLTSITQVIERPKGAISPSCPT